LVSYSSFICEQILTQINWRINISLNEDFLQKWCGFKRTMVILVVVVFAVSNFATMIYVFGNKQSTFNRWVWLDLQSRSDGTNRPLALDFKVACIFYVEYQQNKCIYLMDDLLIYPFLWRMRPQTDQERFEF
jgi:hypothetical protein